MSRNWEYGPFLSHEEAKAVAAELLANPPGSLVETVIVSGNCCPISGARA